MLLWNPLVSGRIKSRLFLCLMHYHTLKIVNLRIRTEGRQRKEDGKRCVTIVTIKMFEKRFRQTSPSSEQTLRKDS